MKPGTHGFRHQRVIARVKLHLIDAPAETVVRMQLGRMHISEPRMGLHFGRAQPGAQLREFSHFVGAQPRCIEFQRIAQGLVGLKQVVVDQQVGLVEDFMGDVHGRILTLKTRSA